MINEKNRYTHRQAIRAIGMDEDHVREMIDEKIITFIPDPDSFRMFDICNLYLYKSLIQQGFIASFANMAILEIIRISKIEDNTKPIHQMRLPNGEPFAEFTADYRKITSYLSQFLPVKKIRSLDDYRTSRLNAIKEEENTCNQKSLKL